MKVNATGEMMLMNESEADKMAQLLRVRGYETTQGLFNGTVQTVPIDVWDSCKAQVENPCNDPYKA